ncbi:MAG: putative Fe-S cluster assembly protein SufT [Gammaproteobacteria bacterium]|nr:putative Fe-S cluster assembly protein SufT [Gammaproteobacteria bacterium]MCH9743619.1 putative Fe-S cluster assembly protein SufT [Gammaproteobacteria bacterium]
MTESREIIVLSRDCMALMVPSGARILLHEGTEVTVTQSLGSSFTVNVYGNLARIEAKDADALGKEVQSVLDDLPEDATLEDKIWTQLKTVFDPEIPVNIVDLGLVYKHEVTDREDGSRMVWIEMTLTAPGCGMGPVIAADAREKVLVIDEVSEVDIELTFDPPWDQSMMSDAAKLELGLL